MAEQASPERSPHRRVKSSVLKSIMVTRSHKRTPTEPVIDSSHSKLQAAISPNFQRRPLISPSPHRGEPNPLGEIQPNANRSNPSPRKETPPSVFKSPQRNKTSTKPSKDSPRKDSPRKENDSPTKPAKSKSATGLSTMFLKSKRSSKNIKDSAAIKDKEKENTTPPASANAEARTPIWAQFATTGREECSSTSRVPTKFSGDEPALVRHNLKSDTSKKQRESIQQRSRPNSAIIPRHTAPALGQSSQNDRLCLSDMSAQPGAYINADKRGSKVLAAIASLTGNNQSEDQRGSKKLDGKDLEVAFEAVLNERNVPENMRLGLRSLESRVKLDFIAHSRQSSSAASMESADSDEAQTRETRSRSSRSKTRTLSRPHSSEEDQRAFKQSDQEQPDSSKRSRSRSKAFSFSKNSLSPAKKRKASRERDVVRDETAALHKSSSSKSLSSMTSQSSSKSAKNPVPEEFVSYLRKVQKPETVEIGKLHRLRLLLRNETVAWVDGFISMGGLSEIVNLLHRIMQIEWREEHEDQLLHEALLCLKGLCTTDLALKKLCDIEATLFPPLLQMLFDEEKKGPSEFTTRGIIINLLCKCSHPSMPYAGMSSRDTCH
jgi:hypothetical protein